MKIKGWAIINWDKSAIVNNGQGQKQIYRTKKLAEYTAKKIGCGTIIIPVVILATYN